MIQNSLSSKAVSEARCAASGKLANAAGGLFWVTEGRIRALAGHRYSPLVVIKTTTWSVPCQQTCKSGQTFLYKQEKL